MHSALPSSEVNFFCQRTRTRAVRRQPGYVEWVDRVAHKG